MHDDRSSDVFFVTILQGWVYKTQQSCISHDDRSSDVFFVAILQGCVYKTQPTHRSHASNNIARMGLQNTTNTRDALMIVWLIFSLQHHCKDGFTTHNKHARCMRAIRRFLCNNNATMGLQNTTNMREMHWWSSDVFFVTSLKGWVYKAQPTCEMHASNQTLSL